MARTDDFSRYDVILSRRPFGDAPVADASAGASIQVATGPSFADTLRIVALTCSQGDIRVGFVDSSKTPPKTYFLYVGENQDGIEVLSANYEAEEAVLRKEGEERTLRIGGGGQRANTALAKAVATGAGVSRTVSGGKAGSIPTADARIKPPRRLSAASQLRLEEQQRRAEAIPDLHGQVLEKHLQEYNMQVIRSGAPPLPIPLTVEQDAQLVSEGVLPPPSE